MKLSLSLRGSEATKAIHKDKAQKVDSSDEAFLSSLRGVAKAFHKKQADSSSKVDCHEVVPTSRNDNVFCRHCEAVAIATTKQSTDSAIAKSNQINTPQLNHTRSKQ